MLMSLAENKGILVYKNFFENIRIKTMSERKKLTAKYWKIKFSIIGIIIVIISGVLALTVIQPLLLPIIGVGWSDIIAIASIFILDWLFTKFCFLLKFL